MTPARKAPITEYLVVLTFLEDTSELFERLVGTACRFFELLGGADRKGLGRLSQMTTGARPWVVEPVRFSVEERGTGGNPLAIARRLTRVLSGVIEGSGVRGATARVYVADGEPSA